MPKEEIPGPSKPHNPEEEKEIDIEKGGIPDPYDTKHEFINPKQSNPDADPNKSEHHTDDKKRLKYPEELLV